MSIGPMSKAVPEVQPCCGWLPLWEQQQGLNLGNGPGYLFIAQARHSSVSVRQFVHGKCKSTILSVHQFMHRKVQSYNPLLCRDGRNSCQLK